ncbi:hypothetical protein MKW98_020257 [Papaver atlanticum]|uniref:J domain-containing protein n=1 Tax=Papaver atlanticum TaxID=357466 RepID=A0AAD4XUT1_9MAGN|nr:hypothetical protein MKW98_020257 [Papaver atlanticum]
MGGNKEKAVRAKELAEEKMNSKDYVGAQIMISKAQKLYPSMENISRMLTVCQVHCSAERKVEPGSVPDWYDILQIEQTADEASIKKQFRQLALLLHPDKNKFPGAGAAFQLIEEANRFLCDQSKRSQFDMKRSTMQQRQSQNQPRMNNYPSKNPVSTEMAALFKRMNPPQQKQQQQTQPIYANGPKTFWTMCPFCSTRYQYYLDIMNRDLRCQRKSCRKPFTAYYWNNQRMPHGANNRPVPQKKDAPSQDGQKSAQVNIQVNRCNVAPASQPPTTSGRASVDGTAPEPNAAEDLNVRVEAGMKEKFIPAEPEPSGTKNRKRERKFVSEKETGSLCDMEEDGDHKAGQSPGLNSGRSSRRKHDVSYKENLSDDKDIANGSRRKTTKINEQVEKDKRKVLLEEIKPFGNAENCKNNGDEVAEDDGNHGRPEPVVVEIPDPEFYDFDRDKSEKCFALDQMWALFDDLDGMPRFYARINKVYYSPFKVDLTWLEFVPGDSDQTAWKRSGLPVACGKFKHEKTDTIKDKGTFSHKIVCEVGARNTYKIYPRKGETWALYKNWNIKWSSDRDNHREFEYEFVVVLSDYINESGILVAQLVKLKGFESLFKRTETNGMSSFQITFDEMFKFSHRVPSVRTNGRERKDVPEGVFELDPASLPRNLEEVSDGKAKTVGGKRGHFELDPASLPSNLEEVSDLIDGKAKPLGEKTERVSEQIPPSPSSFIDPCELPESVFYTFEDDKTEDKFQVGQVWALYCELDGLPKYYGLIKKVELIPEFKVNIQWLEACTSPKGMLAWLDSKMPPCCGVFSSGNETEFDDTSFFSHLSKGAEAAKENKYEIFPTKGGVWAVYKNFCSEWSSSDLPTCEYDIGKVLKVDGTLKVLVLEKVCDYETIFKVQTKAGHESILEIPRHELVKFSHQIPAVQLTDEKLRTLLTDEKVGNLRGCWELDPKAMPVCLSNSIWGLAFLSILIRSLGRTSSVRMRSHTTNPVSSKLEKERAGTCSENHKATSGETGELF